MRNLTEKKSARVAAAVLLALFVFLSSAASVVTNYGQYDNWYHVGETMGFESTTSCKGYVEQANAYVGANVQWLNDPSLDTLGSYAGAAYSYQIINDQGRIVADTTTDSSVFVSEINVERTEQPGFTVRGYVNLPVAPYEGCYSEYAIFSALYGYRYLFLALKYLFLFLGAGMLVVLCLGAVKRGREDRLKGFMKKPFDIVLLLILVAVVCVYPFSALLAELFVTGFADFTGSWLNGVSWVLTGGLRRFLYLLIVAFSLWYLCGQLGAGILTKNLVSGRLLKMIPTPVYILAFFLVHVLLLVFSFDGYYGGIPRIVLFLIDGIAAAVLFWYNAQFRRVRQAAKELSEGNLSYKTDADKLFLGWKELGGDLNRLGDGMAAAVEDQMRSERMKTELITNVSHDLKTPLTSLINYIDLLKSDGLTPEEQAEYLEILDNQSARLKKLTEDVVEASKAASGALTVEEEPIDMAELTRQFLGEYAERFTAAGILPVASIPEEPAILRGDSVLLGRAIDNLMSNVIKYAMPGTRAYIDLEKSDGDVILTVKNVSREPLNISAEELMERFVRGDRSRHTEGSGLGLSIARSLAERMGGELNLYLDGDLFKAELLFPEAETADMAENEGAVI